MPDAKVVAATMLANLNDGRPQVLVLKGSWGCGKSYLWVNDIAPQLNLLENPVVTTSLFGIASVEELRNRLATGAMLVVPKILTKSEDKLATLKQVGSGVVKQLAKVSGQVFDEYAGTSVFASRIDYLELVPDGVTFCIDDMERAGPDVDMRGILGIVNYLVEVKKCRVVLIMDGEQLQEKAEEFHRFKERVVRAVYHLDANMSSAFDRIAAIHLAKMDGKVDIPELKIAVLQVFTLAGHVNLRTLDRALQLIGRLATASTQALPLQVLLTAVVLVLEDTQGKLQCRDHYSFSTIVLLFSKDDLSKSEQHKFLRNYYHDISHYLFVGSVYDAIATGILDESALNNELFASESVKTEANTLMASTRSENFFFLDDAGYTAFVTKVRNRMADMKAPLTAMEAIWLFTYVAIAVERANLTWESEIEDHAQQHVQHAASSPDESLREGFDPHSFMRLQSYTGSLLKIYQQVSRDREANEQRRSLTMAIERHDVGSLARIIDGQWDILKHLTTNAMVFSTLLSSPDTRFRYRAIEMVVSMLIDLSDSAFPWVSDAKRQVHYALQELKDKVKDHAEASRLNTQIERTAKWSAINQAALHVQIPNAQTGLS